MGIRDRLNDIQKTDLSKVVNEAERLRTLQKQINDEQLNRALSSTDQTSTMIKQLSSAGNRTMRGG